MGQITDNDSRLFKLLNQASSDNVNEAILAMRQAQKILGDQRLGDVLETRSNAKDDLVIRRLSEIRQASRELQRLQNDIHSTVKNFVDHYDSITTKWPSSQKGARNACVINFNRAHKEQQRILGTIATRIQEITANVPEPEIVF